MHDSKNNRINDQSKYNVMTTKELEEILRYDAQSIETQETDIDQILCIMKVLTVRSKNSCNTLKTALDAYISFNQNYTPEIENDNID